MTHRTRIAYRHTLCNVSRMMTRNTMQHVMTRCVRHSSRVAIRVNTCTTHRIRARSCVQTRAHAQRLRIANVVCALHVMTCRLNNSCTCTHCVMRKHTRRRHDVSRTTCNTRRAHAHDCVKRTITRVAQRMRTLHAHDVSSRIAHDISHREG